jgi:hypothetical protein
MVQVSAPGRRADAACRVGAFVVAASAIVLVFTGCKPPANNAAGPAKPAARAVFGVPPQQAPAIRLVPRAVLSGLSTRDASASAVISNAFTTSWSEDGKTIAVAGGRSDDTMPGLWVISLRSADGFELAGPPAQLAPVALDAAISPVSVPGLLVAASVPSSTTAVSLKLFRPPSKMGRTLAANATAPAWSPDGTKLAFLSIGVGGSGTFDLSVVDAGGGAPKVVIKNVGQMRPAWTGGQAPALWYLDGPTKHLMRQRLAPGIAGSQMELRGSPETIETGQAQELSASSDGSAVAYLEVTRPATFGDTGVATPAYGQVVVRRVLADGTVGPATGPLGMLSVSTPRISPDGKRVWASIDGGLAVADVGTTPDLSTPHRNPPVGFIPVAKPLAYLPDPSPEGGRVLAVSPLNEGSAALLAVSLWGFPARPSYLVWTAQLPPGADAEKAQEPLYALQPTSEDATTSLFPPGYPDALPAAVFGSELGKPQTGQMIVLAGRYGVRRQADFVVQQLAAAHVRAQVLTLAP